ncbi:hypothetical protein GJR96_08430 [Haloferax sp. MBLA0076]|uniref:Uncharacterized protein n=1 Tax=Haloferax litoreum TaxID=2666140 RepID=A0A6A8GGP8_9EURY|nr:MULTISPECIES: hypothetical protein [Haloferax]KAB1193469.1 hypothetical protein Hfx1148_08425 [Haloferax sp. CBA1148]MRX21981.1 hypothetical protein [Haloferax litoreum]
MATISTLLATGGLALDILGAAIIALPDIPRAKLILWSAVVRRGLNRMEGTGIREGERGYGQLKKILEAHYNVEFPPDVWAMRVGFYTMSKYGYETVYLFTDPDDEDKQVALGKDLGLDVDYRVVKKGLQTRLDRQQAFIRGAGFLLLGTGFISQIVARLIV